MSAIVPIMPGETPLAVRTAAALFAEGVHVVGFCYPVAPKGSGSHSRASLGRAFPERFGYGNRSVYAGGPASRKGGASAWCTAAMNAVGSKGLQKKATQPRRLQSAMFCSVLHAEMTMQGMSG